MRYMSDLRSVLEVEAFSAKQLDLETKSLYQSQTHHFAAFRALLLRAYESCDGRGENGTDLALMGRAGVYGEIPFDSSESFLECLRVLDEKEENESRRATARAAATATATASKKEDGEIGEQEEVGHDDESDDDDQKEGSPRRLLASDVFCDLGSGVGRLVLQTFLTSNVKKAIGVELGALRHEKAVLIKGQVLESLQVIVDEKAARAAAVLAAATKIQEQAAQEEKNRNDPRFSSFFKPVPAEAEVEPAEEAVKVGPAVPADSSQQENHGSELPEVSNRCWLQECSEDIHFLHADMADFLQTSLGKSLTIVFFNNVMFTPEFVARTALAVHAACANLRYFCVSAKILHNKLAIEKKFFLLHTLQTPMSWIERGTVYIYKAK